MAPAARQDPGRERGFVVLLRQETKQAAARERLMPRDATGCRSVQPAEVELDGLERCHRTSGKSNILPQGGTVSGTADAQNPPLDPQLQLLIEAWPTLSKEVQQQVKRLLEK